jgi:hypothetical protein
MDKTTGKFLWTWWLKPFFVISMVNFGGCALIEKNPEVCPTESWEGHYMTEADFRRGTADIRLEKGESVWVLSNRTLKRVLKNVQKQR